MQAPASFAVPERLHVEELLFDGERVTVCASTEGSAAPCPRCGRPSNRVHGRYQRTLADLPWGGVPVELRLRVRQERGRLVHAQGGDA